MSEHQRCYFLSGRVQGVGCRVRVQRLAQQLGGLKGFVRNRLDGRVEIQVCGEPDRLLLFRDALRALPFPVRVDNLVEGECPTGWIPGSEFVVAEDL